MVDSDPNINPEAVSENPQGDGCPEVDTQPKIVYPIYRAGGIPLAENPSECMNPIQEGGLVLLWFDNEVTYLIEVKRGKRVGIHCGSPLLVDDWIGKEYGTKVVCQHGEGFLLKPTMDDLMMKASRESGIIYPKDAAFLMIKSGIASGSKVLEVGTGSGSLTMALAQAVAPTGHVHTFDRRTDLPQNAVRNIARAGLNAYVTFHQREAAEPFPEKGFDAVILDIPTPWEEVDVVKEALAGGGHLVSLNPTFNQIETMAEALRTRGFIQVECCELLQRPILARAGKTRPVQRMVSHTEFLLFAIRPA
ncbi:MAG: tRNA (adenine-N1)-methyltransferase [Candidatus Omnitrophica bacterium]|nr:tRNA (adenine-N1)-methyltransferase [Candidatus Omnitrophota bacterium]MDD5671014.1 tRNA (adenine-N1)-methyltransferase [Candidatus Omnitrophota bacterium]